MTLKKLEKKCNGFGLVIFILLFILVSHIGPFLNDFYKHQIRDQFIQYFLRNMEGGGDVETESILIKWSDL